MPKVSVIVPAYNAESYLSKCLDSLVNQTLQDIEIIAIDDGSKDSTLNIMNDYAARYPGKFVIRHKENGGQGIARNIGLTLASGEYISFLDSDDYYDVTRLEKLYNCAIESGADFVGCGFTEVTIKGETEEVTEEYVGNRPCKDSRDMLIHRALVNPMLNFYKREVLVDHDVTYTEGYIYEDTAFWAKAIPHIKKPVYLEESLGYHTIHDNSTMTIVKANRVRNIFPVLTDAIQYYKEHGAYEKYRNEIDYFCIRILLCSSVERISQVASRKERKELVNETYEYLKREFAGYKKNPCIKGGKVNLYIRKSNKLLTKLMIIALRMKGKR